MASSPKKRKKKPLYVCKYLGNSMSLRSKTLPLPALQVPKSFTNTHTHTYTLAHALTQRACVWVLVWAWTRPGLRFASRYRFVFARAEVLLYDQFRRNVSSAVAARFADVFATHLNLDFTEFNFAVRMTPLVCIGVSVCVRVCVCEFIFFM